MNILNFCFAGGLFGLLLAVVEHVHQVHPPVRQTVYSAWHSFFFVLGAVSAWALLKGLQ